MSHLSTKAAAKRIRYAIDECSRLPYSRETCERRAPGEQCARLPPPPNRSKSDFRRTCRATSRLHAPTIAADGDPWRPTRAVKSRPSVPGSALLSPAAKGSPNDGIRHKVVSPDGSPFHRSNRPGDPGSPNTRAPGPRSGTRLQSENDGRARRELLREWCLRAGSSMREVGG